MNPVTANKTRGGFEKYTRLVLGYLRRLNSFHAILLCMEEYNGVIAMGMYQTSMDVSGLSSLVLVVISILTGHFFYHSI